MVFLAVFRAVETFRTELFFFVVVSLAATVVFSRGVLLSATAFLTANFFLAAFTFSVSAAFN